VSVGGEVPGGAFRGAAGFGFEARGVRRREVGGHRSDLVVGCRERVGGLEAEGPGASRTRAPGPAGAGALGAPLAARDDVLTVIPATLAPHVLAQHLREAEAAAVIKVGRHLPKLRRVLGLLGLLDRARYVERATLAEQRILPLAEVDTESAPYFSMVLVHRRGEAWT